MPKYTLTVLDTAGIQQYIFNSNVLRENIGASQLVWQATKIWPLEIIREQAWSSNVRGDRIGTEDDLDPQWRIESHRDGPAIEVIYAGGGNCVLLSSTFELARTLVTLLSLKLLVQAPGLALIASHLEVDLETDVLGNKVYDALGELSRHKRQASVSMPLQGMGTTVECQSTARPAVATDAERGLSPDGSARPLSAEVLAKLEATSSANSRLLSKLPDFEDAGLRIPFELDQFHPEDTVVNYIAVVHADGNGMGKRIEKIRSDFPIPARNREYIAAMRAFASAIESASELALQTMSRRLLRHWIPKRDEIVGLARNRAYGEYTEVGGPVKLNKSAERPNVPFRPVVFGGDDLTFVTDGRLGLTLAAAYLEAFTAAVEAQSCVYVHGLQASAGIAIVKTHYPFSQAYGLAEELAKRAKKECDRQAALDWHFAQSGLFGSLEAIRRRNFELKPREGEKEPRHLETRPLTLKLEDASEEWRTWPRFERLLTDFIVSDEWKDKRNKVIGLREALRKGPAAVETFLRMYELKSLPSVDEHEPALQHCGWSGDRCAYFDAIEALDFYVPLNWGEEIA